MNAPQQVLNAIKAALLSADTQAALRVFVDRVDPLQPSELPAVVIEESSDGEAAEVLQLNNVQKRTLGVQLQCVMAGATAAADVRELAVAVEKAISTSAALAQLCKLELQLQSNRPVINGDGDRVLAAREQVWRFAYLVDPTAPDIIL